MVDNHFHSQGRLILFDVDFLAGQSRCLALRGLIRTVPGLVGEHGHRTFGFHALQLIPDHFLLCPGVFRRLTVHYGGQSGDGGHPAVLLAQDHAHTVAQGHVNAYGSVVMLVVFIVPDLPYGYAGQLRLILVPDREAMDFRYV